MLLKNADLQIFVNVGGMKISLILVHENAPRPIICKLEFGGISIFLSSLQK